MASPSKVPKRGASPGLSNLNAARADAKTKKASVSPSRLVPKVETASSVSVLKQLKETPNQILRKGEGNACSKAPEI